MTASFLSNRLLRLTTVVPLTLQVLLSPHIKYQLATDCLVAGLVSPAFCTDWSRVWDRMGCGVEGNGLQQSRPCSSSAEQSACVMEIGRIPFLPAPRYFTRFLDLSFSLPFKLKARVKLVFTHCLHLTSTHPIGLSFICTTPRQH